MPCPFAPLLSVIPALPFIPWLIGKSMERLGMKRNAKLNIEGLQDVGDNSLRLEDSQAFSIENLNFNFKDLEFYKFGAPYFRKSKARKVPLAADAKSELLLFSNVEEQIKLQELLEVFIKYPILRAITKDCRWVFKIIDPDRMTPEMLQVLSQDLERELSYFAKQKST